MSQIDLVSILSKAGFFIEAVLDVKRHHLDQILGKNFCMKILIHGQD